LKYAYLSISGNLYPDLNTSSAEFGKLISSDFVSQFVCFTLIFLIVFYTVSKGVKNGIEKLNVWMMPALFILLVLMLIYAMTKDGFMMAV
ncbi:putative sodium:amino-acid symporter family protein, partial [Campylobacter coli 2698]